MRELIGLLSFAFILLIPGLNYAQNPSSEIGAIDQKTESTRTAKAPQNDFLFWLNNGLGGSTSGFSMVAGFNFQTKRNLISLRGVHAGDLLDDQIWDVGLLYGVSSLAESYHASLSAGLGIVGGTRQSGGIFSSEPDENIPVTVGFPVQVQLFWRPHPVVGFGITGFANMNEEQSFAGIAAGLQIGKLK